ncbi:GntR family transcriptional regulator [Leifsonia sp. ZF2019]|uniref:GntR family transcriptional regulator n=1 Tax=Leifsonia sp. ZF2019 TaxID=2781978 RepID=UPI001CBCD7F5|nr:GntR family transcriptional regulator [Leifsonia sp. ZF2019]UAJ80363.1 GntR family transcriptional regulator [Leifsonia sp. ZF2019]
MTQTPEAAAPGLALGQPGVRTDHPEPLWVQAADSVRERIASGELRSGSRLPPERELCRLLGISRVTLRKALQALVEDGALASSHGRGWYVSGGADTRNEWPNSLESFSETAERMGLEATSRVLQARIAPSTIDDAELLGIAPGLPLFRLGRVRMLGGVPIALDWALIPAALLPDADAHDFATASLYEALTAAGNELANAETTIEAREAGPDIAAQLGVEAGTPTLVMHQVVRNRSERAVLASTVQYAGDRYRLRTYFARHNRTETP